MKRNENRKKRNEKNYVALALICMIAVAFVGCKEPEAVSTETSTVEPVSEPASEVVSEEVSEDISEEVVEEVYSAQEVMTLIDDLTARYQYNDPEHIKALVIAANLDYISAEDLDTLLTTYGYTMDDLSALYDACAMDSNLSMGNTLSYYSGVTDSVSPEQEYTNRIALSAVMLNENDKQFAATFDENSRLVAQLDSEARTVLADIISSEYSTSGEHTVVSFAYTLSRGVVMENPYATYQNTMAK